jgi:hypothetical protein
MIANWFALAFAGAWAYVFHWGTGVAAIVLLLVAAYGTQMVNAIPLIGPKLADFLRPLRYDLLWTAFCIAVFLGGMAVGGHDAKNRCVAKQVVIEKRVQKVIKRAQTPKAHKSRDPYASPDI